MMGLMAEQVLADRIESGLIRDFGSWMVSEQRRVLALCHRFLEDRDEANSATQDVFLKAYQALKKEDATEVDDPARWITAPVSGDSQNAWIDMRGTGRSCTAAPNAGSCLSVPLVLDIAGCSQNSYKDSFTRYRATLLTAPESSVV
jgi:hypothetical protein